MISMKPSATLDGLKRTAEENLARAENVLKHFGALVSQVLGVGPR